MSRKPTPLIPAGSKRPGGRRDPVRFAGAITGEGSLSARRASLTSGGPKAQRTSKTSQKLVVLPSAVQTKPLAADDEEALTLGFASETGARKFKGEAERITKLQRKDAGFKRITVYCVAESLKMKLLASFLKREHNVTPRVFDEAMYVVRVHELSYHSLATKI
jgi:uncharacterized Rmd1/YagE family protein